MLACEANGRTLAAHDLYQRSIQLAVAASFPEGDALYSFSLSLPAPLRATLFRHSPLLPQAGSDLPAPDFRITPHYPARSPLDEVLRHVLPGSDGFITERYAFELTALLNRWSQELRSDRPSVSALANLVIPSIQGSSLAPVAEKLLRAGDGIEAVHREFTTEIVTGREQFSLNSPRRALRPSGNRKFQDCFDPAIPRSVSKGKHPL